MGYSIIEACGSQIRVVDLDVLKLSGKGDNYERLQLIHQKISLLASLFHPTELAIEAPFFGKNVQSMLKLGRAQGVAIAAAISCNIPVTEYSPKKIKMSVTGNGNADKEQVFKMLQHILPLLEKPRYYDATDALAVAVCHHFQGAALAAMPATLISSRTTKKKASGWEGFVQQNAHRVVS